MVGSTNIDSSPRRVSGESSPINLGSVIGNGMADFRLIDVPGMLSVPVKSYDKNGNEIQDDGEWHRHTSTTQYVFAEFLVAKGLVPGRKVVSRTPDLVINWSELNDVGKAFVHAAYDKWLRSVDHIGTTEVAMVQKLERRWQKFTAQPRDLTGRSEQKR